MGFKGLSFGIFFLGILTPAGGDIEYPTRRRKEECIGREGTSNEETNSNGSNEHERCSFDGERVGEGVTSVG